MTYDAKVEALNVDIALVEKAPTFQSQHALAGHCASDAGREVIEQALLSAYEQALRNAAALVKSSPSDFPSGQSCDCPHRLSQAILALIPTEGRKP